MQREPSATRGGKRSKGGVFEDVFSAEIGSNLKWKICAALSGVAVLNLENGIGLSSTKQRDFSLALDANLNAA